MRAWAAATAVFVVLAGAGAAAAQTVTRTSGTVSATLNWNVSTDDQYSNESLAISRSGVLVLDNGIGGNCGGGCAEPLADYVSLPPLQLSDLEGTGDPDVLVEFFSGGAHCCFTINLYSWTGTAYKRYAHDFADNPPSITDVGGDGKLELLSADPRFNYEFTSYAFSGDPVQIWRFGGGRFADVTRSFPKVVAHDAGRWWYHYVKERHQGLGLGVLAAWAGDEYLLGKRALVSSTLETQLHLGYLRSSDGLGPSGRSYIRALKRFLNAEGY